MSSLLAHPTAEWNQLYDRFYRKREVYTMEWDVDLENYTLAAAPFGGPVALIRDSSKILRMTNSSTVKPTYTIYTSSGIEISQFPMEKNGKIIKMGWTDQEHLVSLMDDGTAYIYSIYGEILTTFSLGGSCKDQGVRDACIWGCGLVGLSEDGLLYLVENFDEPRVKAMADPGLVSTPVCMAVIEPQFTGTSNVEVLLATQEGSIIVVDTDEAKDMEMTQGPFKRLSVSPTGKMLACFTSTGKLWVISSDFSQNYSEFATKSEVPPLQLVWCGPDSVLCFWEGLLLMVGPYGDWIKYTYDVPAFLAPELDGVRIVTNDACEFLQRVPNVTESIFKIGSTTPAATLFDALEHFEDKSPKADENIRNIKTELADAVDACIEAAGHEFDYNTQRQLLKAASFGKCFLDYYEPDAFVEMCKMLRVINAVRFYSIGIPITLHQLQVLTPQGLVERLINRHEHLLAIRICEYLKLKTDRVLVHWACAKVKTEDSDHDIHEAIVDKLSSVPGVSYVEIASTANRVGRPELATMLLDFEPRAADQVPLLLSMQEDELALVKAIESGDSDLVYLVLLHIQRNRSQTEFYRMIRHKKVAVDLFIQYSKETDREFLKEFFYSLDRSFDTAYLVLEESLASNSTDDRIDKMVSSCNIYIDSKEEFGDAKEHAFIQKNMEDNHKLLLIQEELQQSTGSRFMGKSLNDTIYECVCMGDGKRALKLKSDFKVPDQRFWWLKVKALAETRQWEQLEKFSKEKKSPIGYEPFVEACMEQGSEYEAVKYIQRISDPYQKADFYLRTGYHREAADVAITQKDTDLLHLILSKCTRREDQQYVNNLINQLR
eukprot:TRINITY_DN416_c0_g1_i1.p1 TRINITY_DN416_c0_g1~~TRINITY_DN416_c0_g1_i1.p1  ORF type:complete len:831 (-),score=270.28 TRINITY_DN416_c0_g1_i1:30-2522(-)